mgnify:CR=1 FL=1
MSGKKPKIDLLSAKTLVQDILDNKVTTYLGKTDSVEEALAVITHYLHNRNSPYADTYSENALKSLRKIADKNPEGKITFDDIEKAGSLKDIFNVPYPNPQNHKFTFIDLFAGMGGFRIAMQKQGGKCVFSSEWNKYAQRTYFANFGELPFGDITKEATKQYIPDNFDILCAGFPCQPFSIAGISKKNSLGRAHGFLDKTQGTLFFDVADIINKKRPKAFYLENVKNLRSHNKGNTFKVIYETLTELGYSVHYKVMDGKNYVPQHRERIMIVGFRNDIFGGKEKFEFPNPDGTGFKIRDILEKEVDDKYILTDKLWTYLKGYAAKHKAQGNGFGYGLVNLDGIARTLSARYYKDGAEILIPRGKEENPRRLTTRECARLMGYEDKYIINKVSDVQAYHQCGNSVVVPLITAVSENLVKSLLKDETK